MRTTPSPIRRLRRASGLPVTDFALLLGIRPAGLYAVEVGAQGLPADAAAALQERGVDVPLLLDAQDRWLAGQREELRAAGPDLAAAARVALS